MNFAMLPLDERPVNTSLPQAIGAIAGAGVELPPGDVLPRQRTAGKPDALIEWLAERANDPATTGLIVCLDMALYGGLIPARTSHDSVVDCLARLRVLADIRAAHPGIPFDAVSLVMRASDGYDAGEEPEYWTRYGRELHRLGALLHRRFLDQHDADAQRAEIESIVPAGIRRDFEKRRLRNHQVNLAALDLLSDGALDTLLITADDTASFAAGSVEQLWLAHWARALPCSGELLMYPGADEVGAVLVARGLSRKLDRPVRYRIACAEADGLERIARYENRPVGQAAAGHVRACGGVVVESGEDVCLVIHAPDPRGNDWAHRSPRLDDPAHQHAANLTAGLVERELEQGKAVALADVRYGNGGDPLVVDRLHDDGALLALSAYGGWNTAGNTIGSVAAAATAARVGIQLGSLDPLAARRNLLHRILEDRSYQAGIRPVIEAERGLGGGAIIDDPAERQLLAERVSRHLGEQARRYTGTGEWQVEGAYLPWKRTFEIGFTLTPACLSAK